MNDAISFLENWTVVRLVAAVCIGGGIAAAGWHGSNGEENPAAALAGICIGVCVFAFFSVIATIAITLGAVLVIVKLCPTIARSINQTRSELNAGRADDDELRRAVGVLMDERAQRQLRIENRMEQARQANMPRELMNDASQWEDMR